MKTPNWINEQDACKWLGVSPGLLFKIRADKNINYSYLTKNRVLMYDRNDLENLLNQNSIKALQESVYGKKTA